MLANYQPNWHSRLDWSHPIGLYQSTQSQYNFLDEAARYYGCTLQIIHMTTDNKLQTPLYITNYLSVVGSWNGS